MIDEDSSSDSQNDQEKNTSTLSSIHPRHARKNGTWPQYTGLNTRLRGKIYFSDIIYPDDKWTNWEGKLIRPVDLSLQTPENYHETHNHYQNVLSEVWNFTPGTNAVAMWGDSAAIAHSSLAWGGFFSARSSYTQRPGTPQDAFSKALPQDINSSTSREEFDCQLTGLEVDVLNGGKPGLPGNKAKHGITIVGFGNPNSHALSVICENFDCAEELRRGQFEAGLYFQNSIHPDYGRVLVSDMDRARMGLDFRSTLFNEGAVRLRSSGKHTGVRLNEGAGGEIYVQENESKNGDGYTVIQPGRDGLILMSPDGSREIIRITSDGSIQLNISSINISNLNELLQNEKRIPRDEPKTNFLHHIASWFFSLISSPAPR